jgi:hypothetical protein
MKVLDQCPANPQEQVDAPGCIPSLAGARLADRDGTVVATVVDLVVAPATNEALWLLVHLPDALAPYTFVPAGRLRHRPVGVVVPFGVDRVRSAPVRLAHPCAPSREHAVRLCRHYGVRLPPATWSGDGAAVHADAADQASAALAAAS